MDLDIEASVNLLFQCQDCEKEIVSDDFCIDKREYDREDKVSREALTLWCGSCAARLIEEIKEAKKRMQETFEEHKGEE